MPPARPHVVLLGDSIFDNAAYTGGEPDVAAHLRDLTGQKWDVTLLAKDGAVTADLAHQLEQVPAGASDLVISIGGNDALGNMDLLSLRVPTSAAALEVFAERLESFEAAYRKALARALALGRRTAVCTIYNGALDATIARIARIGVALFDDVILRAAAEGRVDVLELRSVCVDPADYANPIEPSGPGGRKIARGIAHMIGAAGPGRRPARIWTAV
jgi:hypothetical protein